MVIDKNSVVTLGYTLKTRTGLSLEEKQVEQTTHDRPFVFLYGAGMLLPDFETALRGKKSGDKAVVKTPKGETIYEILSIE